MGAEGQTGTAMDSRRGLFQGYTTVITRAIDGIGVPDSFAAIRFNQDGVPTMIWKYWPDIPRSVVDQANALRIAVSPIPAVRHRLPRHKLSWFDAGHRRRRRKAPLCPANAEQTRFQRATHSGAKSDGRVAFDAARWNVRHDTVTSHPVLLGAYSWSPLG
jgi:hypothetical protein